jgi:hypothetical protein
MVTIPLDRFDNPLLAKKKLEYNMKERDHGRDMSGMEKGKNPRERKGVVTFASTKTWAGFNKVRSRTPIDMRTWSILGAALLVQFQAIPWYDQVKCEKACQETNVVPKLKKVLNDEKHGLLTSRSPYFRFRTGSVFPAIGRNPTMSI